MKRQKPRRYKVTKFVSNRAIDKAIEQGYEATFAYFLMLSKISNNSTIRNFSIRASARRIKVSASTLHKHLPIMQSKGLCKLINGHLILKSTRQFKRDMGCLVPVNITKTKKQDLILAIRAVRYIGKIQKIEKAIENKVDVIDLFINNSRMSDKNVNRISKIKKRMVILNPHTSVGNIAKSLDSTVTLSNKSFGSLSNRKERTGAKIQKALNKANYIKSEKNIVQLETQILNRRSFFLMVESGELPLNSFLSNKGVVYQRLANKVSVLTKDYERFDLKLLKYNTRQEYKALYPNL